MYSGMVTNWDSFMGRNGLELNEAYADDLKGMRWEDLLDMMLESDIMVDIETEDNIHRMWINSQLEWMNPCPLEREGQYR